MKNSVTGKEQRQTKRDLFAELSEGMKALADDRIGNRLLSTDAVERKSKRQELLSHLPWFTATATKLPGIRRVALLGSITTNKKDPKDIDFLVVVDDDAELEPLARLGRKIKGRAQQVNRGADIFLANPQGKYIGRTCSWRECAPGIRRSCDALNCGRRHYLHDDLLTLTLSDETVRDAMELWPSLKRRPDLPDDLEETLKQLDA